MHQSTSAGQSKETHHSFWGSSITSRILNFRDTAAGLCSTSPAEAAVCFTTLVKELKNPEPVDWESCGRRSGAGDVVGDLSAGGADGVGVSPAGALVAAVGGGGGGGSGLWRSDM